ncbi:MAG TPA: glucan biosynthesis protein, partial [Lacipirellulaceae bacterium]|nr:glucan biosynthesis protein [Lacipirellulaceae bacterium]
MPAAEPFTFAQVQATARQLAAAPQVTPPRVSDAWFALDYDRYRMIAARHENALWRGTDSPFWAEFFAAGMVYEYPVQIHVVDDQGNVETLKPDDRWFQFRGETAPLATLPGGGFSGVRLLADEPGEQHKTEFMVFQGASYFRARGAGQVYGSSARGLAIDIGLGTPEEFPRFLELWLNKPAAGASQASVWALMNSPAVTGAYKFSIAPGASAAIDVEAHLWFRHGVQKVGIAPLTSMWMWDDDASRLNGDPRPEVHDSDGLLIQEGARHWTWR